MSSNDKRAMNRRDLVKGLRFDASRQVLDWDDKPIARLYAAGEVASCFKHVYQSGGNLAEGIIFGRIAGQNAARQKAWG